MRVTITALDSKQPWGYQNGFRKILSTPLTCPLEISGYSSFRGCKSNYNSSKPLQLLHTCIFSRDLLTKCIPKNSNLSACCAGRMKQNCPFYYQLGTEPPQEPMFQMEICLVTQISSPYFGLVEIYHSQRLLLEISTAKFHDLE